MKPDHAFRLEIDHFQFYFGDRECGGKADTTHLWDLAHPGQRVVVITGLAAVTTARFSGLTTITVTVQRIEPPVDLDQWDGVVKCSIEIPSGEAVLWSPESVFDECPRVQVSPGKYGLLVTFEGITGVNDELATEGADAYHLTLWGPVEADIEFTTQKQ